MSKKHVHCILCKSQIEMFELEDIYTLAQRCPLGKNKTTQLYRSGRKRLFLFGALRQCNTAAREERAMRNNFSFILTDTFTIFCLTSHSTCWQFFMTLSLFDANYLSISTRHNNPAGLINYLNSTCLE